MIYLVNSFSLGMFPGASKVCVEIEEIEELSPENVKRLLEGQGFESYIGHESTAAMLSSLLNINIPANRKMLILGKGQHEMLLVQLVGVRLAEGKILSKEELLQLHSSGHLKLLHLHVKVE